MKRPLASVQCTRDASRVRDFFSFHAGYFWLVTQQFFPVLHNKQVTVAKSIQFLLFEFKFARRMNAVLE